MLSACCWSWPTAATLFQLAVLSGRSNADERKQDLAVREWPFDRIDDLLSKMGRGSEATIFRTRIRLRLREWLSRPSLIDRLAT